MKTLDEIQAEARRLTVLGQQYRNEHSGAAESLAATPSPRELFRLQPATASGGGGPDQAHAPPRQHSVEVVMQGNDIAYRLVEWEEPGPGWLQLEHTPFVVVTADSAFDVLRAGYELAEEERLAERLASYAERDTAGDADAKADIVTEVEEVLEAERLCPSERLRTRAEIAAFLEGRLEPNDLITRAVVRQCHRESPTERESLGIRHALAIDNP